MSIAGGDNVLDSWEEIDEIGLSTQLDQIKKEYNTLDSDTDNTLTENDTMPFHHQNGGIPIMMVMRPNDEEYGANYTQSNKSTVKILRRPTQKSTNDKKLNDNRPKQPIKTLQQREQEYAEARLRILGSAKNPEDELESNLLSKVVIKSSTPPTPPSPSSSSVSVLTSASAADKNSSMPSSLSIVSGSESNQMNQYNYYQNRNTTKINNSAATIGTLSSAFNNDLFTNNSTNNIPILAQQQKLLHHHQQQQQQKQQQQPTVASILTAAAAAASSSYPSDNFSYFSNNFNSYNNSLNNTKTSTAAAAAANDDYNKLSNNDNNNSIIVIRMPRGPDGTNGFNFRR